MDRRLKQSVERIIDEEDGPRRSVIIQAQAGHRTSQRLLSIAAEVHRRRNLCNTARELLPAPQNQLARLREVATKKQAGTVARIKATAVASLAVQVGAELPAGTSDAMASSGRESVTRLLQSDVVRKALHESGERERRRRKTPEAGRRVPAFWSSRSVVLDIQKDDLAKLPEALPDLQDVYPNRTVRTPRLVEAKSVSRRVQEERASAWGVRRIAALSTWGAYGARGKGVKIGVLDTGVDADHPDLKGKVTAWAEFDEDAAEVPGSKPHDSDQHGTHVAGTIVGGRGSGRWIGVAPEAEIAAALVLNGGSGTVGQILAGIEWAIEQKVDVINMSLGGLWLDVEVPDPYTEALLSALAVGIPVVTAIGNEGSQTTGSPGNDWFAFSVGATDDEDRAAGFSGGRTHIVRESRYLDPEVLPLVYSKPEVSAPGVAVYSAVPDGGWAAFNGTSMATPHVAGAIALLLSATDIRNKVAEAQRAFLVEDLLTGSVEELGESGQDHRYGFGRIDVVRAIGFAQETGY